MKNKIKKLSLIIFALFPFIYVSGQSDITVTVESHDQISDGTEIDVEIVVSGIPDGVYLNAYDGTVSWDNRYLTFVSASDLQGATDFTIGNEIVYDEFISGRAFMVSATGLNVTNSAIMKWTFIYDSNGMGECGMVRVDGNLNDGGVDVWTNSDWGEWTAELVPGQVCGIVSNVQLQKGKTEKVNIYPNPVTEYINLSLKLKENKTLNISVADFLGRKVIELNPKMINSGLTNHKIPVSNLSPGIYFLQLYNNQTKDIQYFKFMVE